MAAISSYKMGKKRRWPSGIDRVYDPKDGLEINTVKWGNGISVYRYKATLYDSSTLFTNEGGVTRSLGVTRKVSRANRHRSLNMNSFMTYINRKAYNVP